MGQRMNLKTITKAYLIAFAVIMIFYASIYPPSPIGEWDDYSLPVASIIRGHNISIDDADVAYYKELFPDWAVYIDSYELSDFTTRKGGEMTWYFPVYGLLCIPFVGILSLLGLPAIYTFPYTNIALLMTALVVVVCCLKAGRLKRLALAVMLSVNPIVFYISWPSGEVCIYAFMVIGLTFWYNKSWKRAAFFLSVAGMLNPTILAVGIVMIFEYFLVLFLKKEKGVPLYKHLVHNLPGIVSFGLCFVIGIIPMAYNYYNTGHINLTAAYPDFLQGSETTFERFVSYLLDLNYGILPYFSLLLVSGIILVVPAVIRGIWRYLIWLGAFLVNVALYSVMVHINSGMSGISRYNAWGATTFIFAVVMFFGEIIRSSRGKWAQRAVIMAGAFLTGLIVLNYSPFKAYKVSEIRFTPIARWVLDHFPEIYNPLHSTFYIRTTYTPNGYGFVYRDDQGMVRKMLVTPGEKEPVLDTYYDETDQNAWLASEFDSMKDGAHYISADRKHHIVPMGTYQAGDVILFYSEEASYARYVISGLSDQGQEATWTEGGRLVMGFRMPESAGKTVHLDMKTTEVFNAPQHVIATVNDVEVYNEMYTGEQDLEFDFACPEDGIVHLTFELPDAVSARELGLSLDERVLGLNIQQIVMD